MNLTLDPPIMIGFIVGPGFVMCHFCPFLFGNHLGLK